LVGTENGKFKGWGMFLCRDISEAKRVDVIRDGKEVSINLPGDLNMLNMLQSTPMFMEPMIPAVADSVVKGSLADRIGIEKGSTIVAFNGKPIDSHNSFINEIGKLRDMLAVASSHADSLKARKATITFIKGDKKYTASVTMSSTLQFGYFIKPLDYKTSTVSYSFLESIPAGINHGLEVLSSYVSDMKYVFSAEGVKSLGGFGTIANLFPDIWDWYKFWEMTAFLSIILAFMNILPIPALDGGHVVFLIYEMITGRQPGEKFMLWAEYIGFGILILLMIVANLNDVLRWFGFM
jgi:regulator of sigma E protease